MNKPVTSWLSVVAVALGILVCGISLVPAAPASPVADDVPLPVTTTTAMPASVAKSMFVVSATATTTATATTIPTPTGTPLHVSYLPYATYQPVPGRGPVLISALYYDGYITGELDESFQLYNLGPQMVDLAGWQVNDGRRTVIFPTLTIRPGEWLWCAYRATAFASVFGFSPVCEYGGDSDPAVPDLTGVPLRFGNNGGAILLRKPTGFLSDSLVYEAGDTSTEGWHGPAVQPQPNFGQEGQILYRKRNPASGHPVPDTDVVANWAQDPADFLNGRKVQYPGWDLDSFFQPLRVAGEPAHVTVLVAPDNVFDGVQAALAAAQESIDIEVYTFKHVALAETIIARQRAGVRVRVLLEGSPAGDGIEDQERWIAQQIEGAGGQVYFLVSDRNGAHDRYESVHAKFIIVDGRTLLVGTENLSYDGMPDDDKRDGTVGHRGAYLVTDAPSLVARARRLFEADLDPAHHADVYRWTPGDPKYGAPPVDFTRDLTSGGTGYPVQKPQPLSIQGAFDFEMVHSPENSLRSDSGPIGLAARAGPGDTLLIEQLYERTTWGPALSTPATDPNPRLEAYIAAARRGAHVYILLDRLFDDPASPTGNHATLYYVSQVAQSEGLALEARVGNPTRGGLHNKMILGWIGGRGYVQVGSLNGSETSAKANRELVLQVQSDLAYNYLAEMFNYDWAVSAPR